jgi:RND superfamily putative drug exporter
MLRWPIALAWIAGAIAAAVMLPGPVAGAGQGVGDLVPPDAPAIRAEAASLRAFDVPVLSRVMVVQRDPAGLSPSAQQRVISRAAAIDSSPRPLARRPIAGALPILDTLRAFPGSREDGTTAITYLLFPPDRSVSEQTSQAERFARGADRADDHLVGVTGAIPARNAQTDLIRAWLPWLEVVTVALVGCVLALYFRSFGAPLLTLGAAAIAYAITLPLLAWMASRAGVALPQDVEPIVVALLLGVITDYSVFFLSGFRRRLEANEPRVGAAARTAVAVTPIVFTAGLIVTASSAALLVARLGFLRAFGPALGVTVLVSLLVAMTFVPAVMAIAGRLLFVPSRRPRAQTAPRAEPRGPATIDEAPEPERHRLSWLSTAKPVAAIVALVCVADLVAAAWGLGRMRLGFPLISGLPQHDEVARAAASAERGFAPGVLSPTEILLTGTSFDARLEQLGALQRSIERIPGVAGVLGPALPASLRERLWPDGGPLVLGGDPLSGVIVSKDGSAARLVVIMAADPFGPAAIDALQRIQGAMPAMLREAGLPGVRPAYAGDTAISQEAIERTTSDLVRVAVAALAISFVLLALFLRGLVAPLYLLAASVLTLCASLGLTVLVFQDVLGSAGITYYVPFAAAILLVSLGSDYNVFVVGQIWDEAHTRPLRASVALAAPRAAKTITIAGVVLAGSFAVLAIVPLVQFREFAFVMVVGVLLDAFLVRSLLVPSLIALFGRLSWWPWRVPAAVAEGSTDVRPAA